MAVGSIAGALAAARQAKPRIALLLSAAAVFGFGCALAAIMPSRWLFGLALIIIGVLLPARNSPPKYVGFRIACCVRPLHGRARPV